VILSGVMEPSVKYRSYIRLDLTLLEKPAGDRAWRVVLVGRYPRLSAHPTNNRKQENIKRGTLASNCYRKVSYMLGYLRI